MMRSPFDVTCPADTFKRATHRLPTPATSPARRLARLHLTASMLALALTAFAAPASAQQTGGNGGRSSGGLGGTTSPLDGTATNGAPSGLGGGGGGGAGIAGGRGGDRGGALGGAGGATAGASGSGGQGNGSGGGGGAHGAVVSTFPSVGPAVRGGDGGAGGAGATGTGPGGGGGGGGYGVFVTGVGGVLSQAITGGNGGAGGISMSDLGYGGAGGVGVFFAGSGTLINSSAIQGGAGGSGGDASGSAGGAGVVGAGLTIVNSGTIAGGMGGMIGNSGNYGPRANAITFTGGTNSLTITSSSIITGNVVAFSAADTFGLGGSANASFNLSQLDATAQYRGFGILEKSGSSTWTVTGATGTAMAYRINAGTLEVGDGGTTGSITGDVVNNGTLAFNRSDAVTFDGAISGTGGVTKNGGGTLTLTGANTYSGQTSLMSGTLRQGAAGAFSANSNYVTWAFTTLNIGNTDTTIGGLSGSGRVELGGHVLTVGADNGGSSFAGTIANGDLVKIGSGNFSLDGRASNLASVRVDGGTLSAGSDELASTRFTVNAGAKLSGYGTVGNTTINGGTLAPGSGPATLTVQGNLSFTAASSYRVEVTPQESGRVNVSGTAALSGAAVNAVFLPAGQTKRAAPGTDVYVAKQYTILNATSGLDGKFGSVVNTDLPSGFKTALRYDANNVYLNLKLDFTPTPDPAPSPSGPIYVPLDTNQGNVGKALIGFFDRTGSIPLLFGALGAKELSQISGETSTGSQQTSFNASSVFMGLMSDPDAMGRSPSNVLIMSYAQQRSPTDAFASMERKAPPRLTAPQARWNVWASGFGGSQTTDGNAAMGSSNSKSSVYGMAVGADYWFSPFTVAGVSMAGGGTNFSVTGGGSGRSDLFQVGGFVRHNIGSVYVTAAAAYGWQDITTDRTVTVAGLDQLRANFNANSYSGRFEVGNRFVAPWIGGIGLTPYAAFQVTAFDLPAYTESVVAGSNTFALSYAGNTTLSPRSELGLRSDKSFAVNDAILTLRGRAAWAHDTNRDRSASATFQSLPGASFLVNGASLAKHTALTSASAELKWMNGWSVAGTFEGEFSEVTRSYAGKGIVRYAW